jgi:hypothetical protein
MKLVDTQYVYINSSNRQASETPYLFTTTFQSGDISCQKNEVMKIGVQSFDLYHTWTYVNENNNTFTLINTVTDANTVIVVENGNYTFKQLAQKLTSLYPDWTVTWSSITNKFTFTFTQDHTFSFGANSANKILGLRGSNNSQTTFVSDDVLRTALSERINVHIDNLTPYSRINLENSQGSQGTASTKVLSIINNFSPFDIITYENNSNLYSFYVSEKNIEKLQISLRDVDSSLLTFVNEDCNIVLKIETYQVETSEETNKMLSTLQDIREYLRLMFVSSNLNNVR